MRKFKVSFEVTDGRLYTLGEARDAAGLNDKDLDALADLQVGQTYMDSEDDTWERVE